MTAETPPVVTLTGLYSKTGLRREITRFNRIKICKIAGGETFLITAEVMLSRCSCPRANPYGNLSRFPDGWFPFISACFEPFVAAKAQSKL
jgi:hypothetical protein